MNKKLIEIWLFLGAAILFAQEYRWEHDGTILFTKITSDHVNVRNFPSLEGGIITQLNTNDEIVVTGMSDRPDEIGNFKGFWLKINLSKELFIDQTGWVYSQYVKDSAKLMPSKLIIRKLGIEKDIFNRNYDLLTIDLNRGNQIQECQVYPFKQSTQNYYTFTWSYNDKNFYFTDVPGTYAWYPDTNRLVHVTYMGSSAQSAWVCFTDDFEYMLQDFGTGPGVRGIGVWNVKTRQQIFSGAYYQELFLKNHELEIVYADWEIESGRTDEETERYAKEFKRLNPLPKVRSDDLRNTLLVIYRMNLDTKIRKLKECKYIYTQ